MKITYAQLAALSLCDEIYLERFLEDFGQELEVEWDLDQQLKMLRDPFWRRGWGWAVENRLIPAWSMAGLDLREVDLRGADLSGVDLRRANLWRGSLNQVNLRWANLIGTDLRMANLSGGNLSDADLRWGNLCGANLSETNLYKCNLRWANLHGANLHRAILSEADLTGVRGLTPPNIFIRMIERLSIKIKGGNCV